MNDIKLKIVDGGGDKVDASSPGEDQEADNINAVDNNAKYLIIPSKLDNLLILLVEDNPVNQFIVVETLKKWNMKVDVANSGLEALEKIKNNDYKLILMDTHMPVMSGNDTTRRIRKEMADSKKNIPIICFSASTDENEIAEAKIAGATDYINKSSESKNLADKIRKLTITK